MNTDYLNLAPCALYEAGGSHTRNSCCYYSDGLAELMLIPTGRRLAGIAGNTTLKRPAALGVVVSGGPVPTLTITWATAIMHVNC